MTNPFVAPGPYLQDRLRDGHTTCPVCGGWGQLNGIVCKRCKGTGWEKKKHDKE